jgi:hypothetical protein
VRFQVLTAAMMEAVRSSETSVDNHFTRQYIPEDNSEHVVNTVSLLNKQLHIEWKKGEIVPVFKHHIMMEHGVVEVRLYTFLNS